jgi:hypothetical protein
VAWSPRKDSWALRPGAPKILVPASNLLEHAGRLQQQQQQLCAPCLGYLSYSICVRSYARVGNTQLDATNTHDRARPRPLWLRRLCSPGCHLPVRPWFRPSARELTSEKFLLKLIGPWPCAAPFVRVLRRLVLRFLPAPSESEPWSARKQGMLSPAGLTPQCTGRRTSKSSSPSSATTSSVASLSSLLIRFSRIRCISASVARAMFTVDLRLDRRVGTIKRVVSSAGSRTTGVRGGAAVELTAWSQAGFNQQPRGVHCVRGGRRFFIM